MEAESKDPFEVGKTFIKHLIVTFWLLAAVYLVAHWAVGSLPTTNQSTGRGGDQRPSACPTEQTKTGALSWQHFVTVAPTGEVEFHNRQEMDWYVGAERVEELAKPLRETEAQTLILVAETKGLLRKMDESKLVKADAVRVLRTHIEAGRYLDARVAFETLWSALSSETRSALDRKSPRVSTFGDNADKIHFLLNKQCNYASEFASPSAASFFWTSPSLSILEVYFWALFGVLTNLFYNSTEHLRKGTFNPNERWVAYTKAHYGPVLAVVLVLAMVFGWFKIESYAIRVWTLPLVGFIFGYAARRTARLFETVLERFMGKAEEAANAGPKAARASNSRVLNKLIEVTRPRTFEELRQDAKKIGAEIVEKALADKEKRT